MKSGFCTSHLVLPEHHALDSRSWALIVQVGETSRSVLWASSLWQNHRKLRPFVQLALHRDGALHLFDDVLDDRKAQTGAPHLARPRLVHTIEALEDARQVLGRNPDTAVGNADSHPASGQTAGLHPDFPAPAVELDGVIQQVHERLLQLDLVAHHLQVLYRAP